MKKIVVGDCYKSNSDLLIVNGAANDVGVIPMLHVQSGIEIGFKLSVLAGIELLTLHLPISEPWFSHILSGEKTEEYRECKAYYVERFCDDWDWSDFYLRGLWMNEDGKKENGITAHYYKPWKVLHLTNGYGHHRPQLWAHIKEIAIGRGNPEWGAPEHDVFIIKLGEVFHTKNIKK